MRRQLYIAFRTMLVRAAAAAEDHSIANLTVLERVCHLVAEQTPSLTSACVEYLWRKHTYHDPIGARDLIIDIVLSHYQVGSSARVA